MTAIQHGMPGEWAKVRGTVMSLWPLFLCFVALGAFGAALVLGSRQLLFGGLFLVLLVVIYIVLPMVTIGRRSKKTLRRR